MELADYIYPNFGRIRRSHLLARGIRPGKNPKTQDDPLAPSVERVLRDYTTSLSSSFLPLLRRPMAYMCFWIY